jgi:hypothetical protein
MPRTKIDSYSEAQDNFLIEGARSYLDAAIALVAYEQDVQKKCRAVMENQIDDYTAAIKTHPPLTGSDIQPGVWPKPNQSTEDYRSVGVYVMRKNVTPGLRWWEAYCCLEWQLKEPKCFCWVGEWYPTRRLAVHLAQKFRRLNTEVSTLDDNNVGISKSLNVDEGAIFEEKLEGLFEQWIKLWKKAGGIKEVFKNVNSPE